MEIRFLKVYIYALGDIYRLCTEMQTSISTYILYETFLQEFTALDMFYHDFRKRLVLF